ncbi:MAG: hypothetical protein ABSD42_04520 [Candidatus Bathyarchaeia archaeon]|jgi:hypothetical protein
MKYSEEIVKRLAIASVPLSPFDLKTATKYPYSGIRETIKRLCIEGFVQLKSTETSQKGGPRTLYTLTFKGLLKYLSQSYRESHKEFDPSEKKLLQIIESQGVLLNYPLFQEIKWFYERDTNILRYFLGEAKYQLSKPPAIGEAAEFAEALTKYIGDPSYGSGIKEDIALARNDESMNLMDDFAEHFLIYGLGGLSEKGQDSNAKLCEFATKILNDKLWDVEFLERAVRIFAEKEDPPKLNLPADGRDAKIKSVIN